MENKLKRNSGLLVALTIGIIHSASAALIGLNTAGYADELSAITSTITNLGHTIVNSSTGVDLVIAYAGGNMSRTEGIPYIQISDWGNSEITDSAAFVSAGTPVQINLTGSHDILNGLDSTWTTRGFWLYTAGSEYVGSTTGADQNLADAVANSTTYNNSLAMNAAGDQLYIGWNVYGPQANANDVQLLSNAIDHMAIPEPSVVGLYGMLGGALVFGRRYMQRSRRAGKEIIASKRVSPREF